MGQIILDTLQRNDIEFIYKAMSSSDQYLFSTRLPFKDQEAFEEWLTKRIQSEFHDFRMVRILEKSEKHTIGFVYDYDFNLKNGNTKITLYIDERYRMSGAGGAAGIVFLGMLFNNYPLRCIYSTVYDYNSPSLKSVIAAGFKEAGVLKDYRYHNGKWHNLHVFSISRAYFEEKLRKLYEIWL